MTAPYTIHVADGYIEVAYSPQSRPEDHLNAALETLSWLRMHRLGLLVDWSAAIALPSRELARGIVELAAINRDLLAGGVAFLVEPGVKYGVARMEQILGELQGIQTEVFTDRASAVGWLKARAKS